MKERFQSNAIAVCSAAVLAALTCAAAPASEDPFNHTEVHCTTNDHEKCESGKKIDLTYIKDLDKHWMDYSVDFIKKMKGAKEPFFLYHATRGCHFDNCPSDEWAGKSRARTVYSDCMVHMDYVLDQLVKALDETGQLENTLIVLTSDNGPECEIPPHARTPFRGCKGSSWEGGVRVPTFAYWKGMIAPRRSERPPRPQLPDRAPVQGSLALCARAARKEPEKPRQGARAQYRCRCLSLYRLKEDNTTRRRSGRRT